MVAAYAQFGTIHEETYAEPMYASIRKLHSYQYTSLQLSFDTWNLDVRRQMVVLPTGCGKTVLFAVLPLFYKFKKRILVLVHRDTLAGQARNTIQEWNPYAGPVGIEMGNKYRSRNERVVVASVQTIGKFSSHRNEDGTVTFNVSKRLMKFNPDDFDAVIVDECHHAVAAGYKNILRHFGFLDDQFNKVNPAPRRLLLGVTATPRRLDKRKLGEIFDKKVFEYPIEDAIREGWLVNPRCFRIRTSVNLEGIDLDSDDLEKLSKKINTPARNELIVKEWQARAAGRKTVCFAVDVQHAVDLAVSFRNAGVKATAVWGDDPQKDRKLKDFKRGLYEVLCNCEILTEGYDDRSISAVILARPTDSESLFKQMVGRGMRLEPGVLNILQWDAKGWAVTKRDCIVIEVLDAKATEHSLAMTFAQAYDLPDDFDLEGSGLLEAKDAINQIKPRLKRDEEEATDPAQASKPGDSDEGKRLDEIKTMAQLNRLIAEKLHATVEEIDLLRVTFDPIVLSNSQLQWHRLDTENYILVMPYKLGYIRIWRNDAGAIVIDGTRLKEEHRFIVTGSRRREDFGRGFRAADQQVLRRFGQKIFDICERNSNSASWKSLPASKATLARLKHLYDTHGLQMPEGITRGEASLLIAQMMAKAAA